MPPVEVVQYAVRSEGYPLTLFLLLRAFASGCAALTGVEAISNGVQAFQPPEGKNAATTMVWMAAILMTLFLGITFEVYGFRNAGAGIVPVHNDTVISQLAKAAVGHGG